MTKVATTLLHNKTSYDIDPRQYKIGNIFSIIISRLYGSNFKFRPSI